MEILINADAEVKATTKHNENCLHLLAHLKFQAEKDGKNLEKVMRLLNQKGVQANQQTNNGNTPLHIACLENNNLMVNYLLSCTTNLQTNLINLFGDNPLFIAARKGNSGIVAQLLQFGFDASLIIRELHNLSISNDLADVLYKNGIDMRTIRKDIDNKQFVRDQLSSMHDFIKKASIPRVKSRKLEKIKSLKNIDIPRKISLLPEKNINYPPSLISQTENIFCKLQNGNDGVIDKKRLRAFFVGLEIELDEFQFRTLFQQLSQAYNGITQFTFAQIIDKLGPVIQLFAFSLQKRTHFRKHATKSVEFSDVVQEIKIKPSSSVSRKKSVEFQLPQRRTRSEIRNRSASIGQINDIIIDDIILPTEPIRESYTQPTTTLPTLSFNSLSVQHFSSMFETLNDFPNLLAAFTDSLTSLDFLKTIPVFSEYFFFSFLFLRSKLIFFPEKSPKNHERNLLSFFRCKSLFIAPVGSILYASVESESLHEGNHFRTFFFLYSQF